MSVDIKILEGAGFGGNRQRSNAPVSGISKDYIQGIAGLCEGRIEGLPNGAKDITLNGTPLQNEDGSFNFENFNWDFRPGTLDQTPFPNSLNEISIENTIGISIPKATPATRTATNADATALRIRLAIQLDNQGQESEVSFNISIREGTGGTFVQRANRTIRGRYVDFTVFQFFFQVDPTVDEYSVRVQKTSDDSTTTNIRNLQWLTLTEVTQKQIAYVNTALLWYNFNSELFQSDPEVGILLATTVWQIPTNASVVTAREDRGLTFAGGWDGTFYDPGLAITDPAWAIWGMLTRPRTNGGLGFSPSQVNKWDLYLCSVYNNELVSDGFGGQERRYSFNGLITEQQVTLETIRSICSTFATKPYWDGKQICFWQQRPSIVLPRILGNADVRDGRFFHTFGEYQSITTACRVWRSDPDNDYEPTPEPIEDDTAIAQYGYFQEEFTALGVLSRGAAIRAGRRIIYNSQPKYNKSVSFDCRPHALFFKPGEIIQIADSGRSRQRKAGLVSDADTTTVVLDYPTTITDAIDRRLLVTLTDFEGNIYTTERQILNPAGTHTVIFLSEPLPEAPLPQTSWQIVDGAVDVRQYQILAIEPSKDNKNFYSITAKLYSPELETKIESNIKVPILPSTPRPPSVMPPPGNLSVQLLSGSRLDATWSQPVRVLGGEVESYTRNYIAEYRLGLDGTWGDRQTTNNTFAQWVYSSGTIFYVRVAAVSTEGKVSQWVEARN